MRSQETKNKFEKKDFIALAFSGLALFVSVASAYFNIFRVEEKVSLIVQREPLARKVADVDSLYIPQDEEGEVILINPGNRPVAILSIELLYAQPESPESQPDCSIGGIARFRTTFAAIVVKPGDVVVRAIKISKPYTFIPSDILAKQKLNVFFFPAANKNKGKDDILIDACLDVSVATPTTSLDASTFPISRYHAIKDGWYWNFEGNEGPLLTKPKILLDKTYTIFAQ